MTDRLSIAVHAFASRVLMSLSVDETRLPRKVNLSTSFGEVLFSVEMSLLTCALIKGATFVGFHLISIIYIYIYQS